MKNKNEWIKRKTPKVDENLASGVRGINTVLRVVENNPVNPLPVALTLFL